MSPKTPITTRRRRESGQVILLALLVLVLLSAALLLLAANVQLRASALAREAADAQLTALTDAALAESLAQLARRRTFRGLPATELGRGEMTSEVERLDDRHVVVTVRASYRGRTATTQAQVFVGAGGPRVVSWQRQRSGDSGASRIETGPGG